MPSVAARGTDNSNGSAGGLWALAVLSIGIVAVAAFMLGRSTAPVAATSSGLSLELIEDLRPALEQQREQLEASHEQLAAHQAAVARRLGQLQAQVMRLNATGQRLTEVAQLDAGEFDFSAAPPVGGPLEPGEELLSPTVGALEQLESELVLKERQLDVLEQLLLVSQFNAEQRPSGWPVASGWISSLFGRRSDPFSGRLSHHGGVDFAASLGSDVLAIAGGIVEYAGTRSGYGNVVEINHGNGYVTRYGHNRRNLVRIGERVVKGQAIAKVGSSGRATGPHVHLEVLVDGVTIDPYQFVSQR